MLGATNSRLIMEILINKRYEVFLDGQLTYLITSKFFSFHPKYSISEFSSDHIKLVFKGTFAVFHKAYDIYRGNDIYNLRLKKAWKTQYNCQVGKDLYEIYVHRGLKHSVFKNGTQIGWWNSDSLILLGSRYKIIADKDADSELLIAFCIALEGSNGGATVNVGNVGGQGKTFDSHWQPKY